MGLKSRNKGKTGEREIAAIVRDLTGWDVKRRVRQHDGDSDLEGIPNFTPEVKRHATATRADVREWWKQAAEQAIAENRIPVLFYRRDRDEWRAVWPLGVESGGVFFTYQWTAEGTVDAWAAVAREIANTETEVCDGSKQEA